MGRVMSSDKASCPAYFDADEGGEEEEEDELDSPVDSPVEAPSDADSDVDAAADLSGFGADPLPSLRT